MSEGGQKIVKKRQALFILTIMTLCNSILGGYSITHYCSGSSDTSRRIVDVKEKSERKRSKEKAIQFCYWDDCFVKTQNHLLIDIVLAANFLVLTISTYNNCYKKLDRFDNKSMYKTLKAV